MPHDGQDLPLLALTEPALAEARTYLAHARTALAKRVVVSGKVSPVALEVHQYAAHGLAWLAFYVQAWAEVLSARAALARWRR